MMHSIYRHSIIMFEFSATTNDFEKVLMLFSLAGVLVLLYLQFDWELPTPKEGFGATMRHAGERSDGYAVSGSVVRNTRTDTVEGLGGNEPPVFWNAGSVKDINQHMQQTNNQVVDVDYSVPEGMYGRKKPAYEGMENRFSDASLGASGNGQ